MSATQGGRLAELAPKIMGAFHDLGQQHPKGEKVSMRQYQALIVLHTNKSLTLSQFCEKLALAPSTGTELANRLIDLGYFSKEEELQDRRQVVLSVTQQGHELLEQRRLALTEMFDRFLRPFSQEERVAFVAAFDTIWSIIKKHRSSTH
jgi:DNA-binding MarR family transcriptional regulator